MGAKPVGWALVLTAWKLQLVLTSARPHVSLGLSDTHRTRLMIEAR